MPSVFLSFCGYKDSCDSFHIGTRGNLNSFLVIVTDIWLRKKLMSSSLWRENCILQGQMTSIRVFSHLRNPRQWLCLDPKPTMAFADIWDLKLSKVEEPVVSLLWSRASRNFYMASETKMEPWIADFMPQLERWSSVWPIQVWGHTETQDRQRGRYQVPIKLSQKGRPATEKTISQGWNGPDLQGWEQPLEESGAVQPSPFWHSNLLRRLTWGSGGFHNITGSHQRPSPN